MIDRLKVMTDKLLVINSDDKDKAERYKLIRRILESDDCFFKMNIEVAYSILRDLKIDNNDIKDVYCQLIDINNME